MDHLTRLQVIMRDFWRFLTKGFLSVLGLSLGVIFSVITIMAVVVSISKMGDANLISLPDASGEVKELGKKAPIIAVLEMRDVIASSRNSAKNVQDFLLALDQEPFKNRVKALVIDMDCPGGEVFEIARIYSTLQFWKQRTGFPVYVFVNGLCASGGYYVSCASDKIYSSTGSLIGSIGVRSGPYFNVKEGLKRYGVESMLLSAGQDKAPLNPYTPWTEEERLYWQDLLDFLYRDFVNIVTQNRPSVSSQRLVEVLGARIFSPERALQEGLIDVNNATKAQVLQELAEACGIAEDYRVVGSEENGLLKRMMLSVSQSPLVTGKMQHEFLPSSSDRPTVLYLH